MVGTRLSGRAGVATQTEGTQPLWPHVGTQVDPLSVEVSVQTGDCGELQNLEAPLSPKGREGCFGHRCALLKELLELMAGLHCSKKSAAWGAHGSLGGRQIGGVNPHWIPIYLYRLGINYGKDMSVIRTGSSLTCISGNVIILFSVKLQIDLSVSSCTPSLIARNLISAGAYNYITCPSAKLPSKM